MHDESPMHPIAPVPGWQQRRGGVRFYFCCCPLLLALAPVVLAARLLQYGVLRLLGRDPASPWAGHHAGATDEGRGAA